MPNDNLNPEATLASPRATGSPEDRRIGQPEGMWLDEYGSLLVGVFGYCVYHVGSSMSRQRGWSDVDIRVILTDEQYAAWGLGKPEDDHRTPRWLGLCKAFSEIGKRITGLPIDFQIQQQTAANKDYGDKPRSALFKHDGSTVASDDLPASPSRLRESPAPVPEPSPTEKYFKRPLYTHPSSGALERAAQVCDEYAKHTLDFQLPAMSEVNAALQHDAWIAGECARRIRALTRLRSIDREAPLPSRLAPDHL